MPVRVQSCLLSPTKVDLRSLIMLLTDIQYTKRGKRTVENKHLLRLMPVPVLQEVGILTHFESCEHISCVTRDRVWISETNKLVLIDIPTGKHIHTLNDVVDGFWSGLHTLNTDCELFYISNDNSIIKLSNDNKTASTVYKKKDTPYHPKSLYCSPSTGDLLIGMNSKKIELGLVARLTKTKELTVIIPND